MDSAELLKKLVITLVAVFVLIAGAYYGFRWLLRDSVESPLLEFLSLFGSVFLLAGLGLLAKARQHRRERSLLSRGVSAALEQSGRRAVAGIIEPIGEPLPAPFSDRPCVAYDYSISTGSKTPSGRRASTYQLHFAGMHLTPSRIRSPQGDCKLLAFPNLEHFEEHVGDPAKAQGYLDRVSFEELRTGVAPFDMIGAAAEVFVDDDGAVAKDWRLEPVHNLNEAKLKERVVAPGATVCAIGVYDAARGGLVPDRKQGGVTLHEGSFEEVLADMGASTVAYIVFGIFFLLAAAGMLAPIAMDMQ